MSDPITMLDSDGNPLAVGMAVLWKGHGRREFRPGWVRDIVIDNGKPSARIDDGAEWDGDLNGRTWSMAEWVTDPRKIRPRREQPLPDPRIAELTAEVERLRAAIAESVAFTERLAVAQMSPALFDVRDHLRARLETPND